MIVSEGYTVNNECIVQRQVLGLPLTTRVRAADELVISAQANINDDRWLAEGDPVVLAEHGIETSDGSTWSEILFSGSVVAIVDDVVGETVSYRCVNAWADLGRIVFETTRSGDASDFARTHCILGRNGSSRRTTTNEIMAALDWAKEQNPGSFDYTIDAAFPSEYPPPDEVVDLTCAEVVEKMLRYIPNAVTRWDYSQTPPHLYIELADAADAESLDLDAVSLNECMISRRADRDINGVRIYIERAHYINGSIDDASVSTSTTGETTGLGVLRHTIELEGKKEEIEYNTITSQRWASYDALEILEQVFPEMFNTADYDYDDFDTDIATYGVTPYVITAGEYKEWMEEFANGNVDFNSVALHVEYTQTRKDDSSLVTTHSEDISLPMIGGGRTRGGEQTFERTISSAAQENIGDIASTIFDARQLVKYEGVVGINLERQKLTFAATRYPQQLAYSGTLSEKVLSAGGRLNIQNGRADWTTMNALISELTISLLDGTVSYQIGPPDALSAGDLISMCRNNRLRTKPTRTIQTA